MIDVDKLNIDFVKWMSVYASPTDFEGFDVEWIDENCRTAVEIIFAKAPAAVTRWQKGTLSERTLAYVACSMVLRTARYGQPHSESDGSYAYTNNAPQQMSPAYDSSPNLFVSKNEMSLLDGGNRGPIGTIGMGAPPLWGR